MVHTGDLVFNRRQPFIDRGAGASVVGWVEVLEAIHERHADETVFVFGHAGEGHDVVGTRADLLVMRDFLTAAREAIVPLAEAGRTVAEIEGLVVPGFDEWGPTPARVVEPIVAEFVASE